MSNNFEHEPVAVIEDAVYGPPVPSLEAQASARIETLEAENTTLRESLTAANERALFAVHALSSFKQQVREIAIEQHKEGRWCRDGLNEKLDELGIDTYTPRYRVDLSFEVSVEVECDDADSAGDMARSSISVIGDDDIGEPYVGDIYVRTVEECDE